SCRCRSNLAARVPRSSSPMQTRIGLSMELLRRCASPGRASPAPRAPASSYTATSLNALGQKVKALKLGDPLDETSDIGTIINEKQFRKVCGYVEEGLKRREAHLVTGGLPPK